MTDGTRVARADSLVEVTRVRVHKTERYRCVLSCVGLEYPCVAKTHTYAHTYTGVMSWTVIESLGCPLGVLDSLCRWVWIR